MTIKGRSAMAHAVFGLTLAALGALSLWWTVFFGRAVELERSAALDELSHRAELWALRLGHRQGASAGPLEEAEDLVVERCDLRPGSLGATAEPNHDFLCVRPTELAISAVEGRMERRQIMVVGEGAFLFLLICVCVAMLYRLVVVERRALRGMETFVAALTHEMKTPLAGIKSLVQTLAAGRVQEKDMERFLSMGLKEIQRLDHSIENVLIAGALRTGRHQVKVDALELGPWLKTVVDQRMDLPSQAGLEVAWEVPSRQTVVEADSSALRVVVDNLLDNGIKYGQGKPLTIVVRMQTEHVAIDVIDRGDGFEGESEELFRPFSRGKTDERGTGLGLSIARALARAMGGKLGGHSNGEGKGARFTIELRATSIDQLQEES